MKVLTPGYEYGLENVDEHLYPNYQPINFIHKMKDKKGNSFTYVNGTTVKEVLEALIARVQFVYAEQPYKSVHIASLLSELQSAKTVLEEFTSL